MATLDATYLTLLDWATRQKPGGGVDDIIEVLSASNPIIADAHVKEGNLPTGHRSTQRTSQPSGSWRLLNQGVAAEKSTTVQVTDTCGILEGYSKLDVDEASLNGDEAAYRASEDNAFIAGMNDTVATAVFYGDTALNPEQMHGFSPRYNLTTGDYGDYIIDGAGAGSDNTSVWIITWGDAAAHLIFPKGSMAGLQNEDLGKQLVLDTNSNYFQAFVTKFQWKLGLAVRDFRYISRICNIDISDLTTDASSGVDLLDNMLDAYYARPSIDLGNMARTYVYCNKTIAKFLHKQAMNKSNVNLTLDTAAGKPVVSFLDAPVRVCDAIAIDESVVS